MRNVGVDQMEDEGGVQEDCGKQVGCTEVRHFRECWEPSGKSQLELEGDSRVHTKTFRLIYHSP